MTTTYSLSRSHGWCWLPCLPNPSRSANSTGPGAFPSSTAKTQQRHHWGPYRYVYEPSLCILLISGPALRWTGYSSIKQQYYDQGLGRVFPEVWLCKLDWKADKLTIDAYPSWYSTYLWREEERIAQVTIKSEHSDKTSMMAQKHLRSPLPLTVQKKKKAKHAGRNPIPVASEIPPVPPSSEISPEALPTCWYPLRDFWSCRYIVARTRGTRAAWH